MRDAIDWQLLSKYLAGECSPEEARAVSAWLDADPSRRDLMKELKSIWDASDAYSPPAMDLNLDDEWDRLSEAMTVADARAARQRRGLRRSEDRPPQPRRHRTRPAAPSLQNVLYVVLAGLVLIGGLWFGLGQWNPGAPDGFREVVAERGERAKVQLLDGTDVTLNVDSRLRIPTAFGETERTVHLEGEAYFDVATDSTRPFVIHTRDAIIDVHGTAFNVRSYPEETRVQVAVVEGSVSLRAQRATSQQERARLEPGQVGRLDAAAAHVTTQTVDSLASLIGWMDGRLVFENEPLSDVAARLERWYDLRFELDDPALDSLRLTASLKSRSVENVLDVITASLGIRYRMHRNTVVLSDEPPPAAPPSTHR